MRALLVFCTMLIVPHAFAQFMLQGKVLDSANRQPLSSVSVFISNTSVGTITKPDGSFSLTIPQGSYEIVFSYVGYATKTFATNKLNSPFTVELLPVEKQLEDIVLIPFEKNGWASWGKFFTDFFIGTSDEASQCRIQNTKAIRFRRDKIKNTLTAVAFEPLILTNKALGYTIQYQMEEFRYDFESKYLFYQGYHLFTEMKGNEQKQKRWQQRRQDVYEGSQMHFMRSLYRNTITEEGFDVYRLLKQENIEKKRVREFLKHNPMPQDSTRNFENILSQPDERSIIYSGKLTGDSIAYAIDEVTAGLEFENYLYIVYNKKKAPAAYVNRFNAQSSDMASEIIFLEKLPLEIQANGNFYPPQSLLNTGFWGWSEKMSRMLPYDYKYNK